MLFLLKCYVKIIFLLKYLSWGIVLRDVWHTVVFRFLKSGNCGFLTPNNSATFYAGFLISKCFKSSTFWLISNSFLFREAIFLCRFSLVLCKQYSPHVWRLFLTKFFRLFNLNLILEEFKNCFIDCRNTCIVWNLVLNKIEKCRHSISSKQWESPSTQGNCVVGNRFSMVVSCVLQIVAL